MSKHSEMRRSEFALRNKQFLTNLHLHCQATLLHRVKSGEMWSFSGLYFPAFGLNTEWYCNSPHSVWMRENTDLKKLRIWTAFTQYYPIWAVYEFLLINWNALLICKVFHFDKSKTKTSMDCPYTGSVCVCVCVCMWMYLVHSLKSSYTFFLHEQILPGIRSVTSHYGNYAVYLSLYFFIKKFTKILWSLWLCQNDSNSAAVVKTISL